MPFSMSKCSTAFADDLDYLQAEVQWAAARCYRIGAQHALEKLGLDSDSIGDGDNRERHDDRKADQIRQQIARHQKTERRHRAENDARLAATREAGVVLAMDHLCATCGLDALDRQLLILLAMPCLSSGMQSALDAIEPTLRSAGFATVDSALTFLEASLSDRVRMRARFRQTSPLMRSDLVRTDCPSRLIGAEDLLSATLRLAPRAFCALVGDDGLDDELREWSTIETPRATLADVVLPDTDRARILAVTARHDLVLKCRKEWGLDDAIRYGRGMTLLFSGPPGTGKTLTAHGIASLLGRAVLRVDVATLADACETVRFLPSLFREARLQNALLFFDEADVLLAGRQKGNGPLMASLLSELEAFDGIVVFATNRPEDLDEALFRRLQVHIKFCLPDTAARLEIWRKLLPPRAPISDDVDLWGLAEKFPLAGGHIKNAVLCAVADAVYSDGENGVLTQARLATAAGDQLASLPVATKRARGPGPNDLN